MNFCKFKYLLIFSFATTLLFKAGGTITYLNFYSDDKCSSSDVAGEEENKIEKAYFDDYFLVHAHLDVMIEPLKKIISHNDFVKTTYIPEVLTPPPLS
ncbi:hypothetical protein [Pedobacter punctiformis]|uniref:Uncharacterized protein n=1 Tax=Pedobacter punctiformis TaxID=3004097 RepID=A0ABT4LDC2_9SPHI|nr:hypothetical protein [Pedobacter sp. HCMS5-2]MCZ4245163.1 hypothetical protein [Pedobacter sp. HCMS5-2]